MVMSRRPLQVFAAELAGTFLLVLAATGSIVADAEFGLGLGVVFAAAAPMAALIIGVRLFSKISLAQFNPAVTLGLVAAGHLPYRLVPYCIAAQMIGAFAASLAVMVLIGTQAGIGANIPGEAAEPPVYFVVEVLATAMLMAVILAVVRTGGLRGFGGLAIGGIVAFDILLFSAISGASMNPARALAPAVLSGSLEHMWLYWSATFAGAGVAAAAARAIRARAGLTRQ